MNTLEEPQSTGGHPAGATPKSPPVSFIQKVINSWNYRVVLPLRGLKFDLFNRGRFQADGCVFEIPKKITSLVFRGNCSASIYEIRERTMTHKYLRPDDSVIELGACLGIVSCSVNAMLKDKTRYLAVEANPQCIPTLTRNRDLNHCGFQIDNCAVSNESEVTLFLDPNMILIATPNKSTAFPVAVPGRTLSELCRQHGPFSVLIMDIEGSELEMLEASMEILPNFRLIVGEFHEGIIGTRGVDRCREILQKAGFKSGGRMDDVEAWLRS